MLRSLDFTGTGSKIFIPVLEMHITNLYNRVPTIIGIFGNDILKSKLAIVRCSLATSSTSDVGSPSAALPHLRLRLRTLQPTQALITSILCAYSILRYRKLDIASSVQNHY